MVYKTRTRTHKTSPNKAHALFLFKVQNEAKKKISFKKNKNQAKNNHGLLFVKERTILFIEGTQN